MARPRLLDIQAIEQKWRFDFATHFKPELEDLQKMQADGLLLLKDNVLRVLPAGRLLVRNICMVFDRYLRNGDDQSRFSKVI